MTALADHDVLPIDPQADPSHEPAATRSGRSAVRRTALGAAGALIGLEVVLGWSWLSTAAAAIISASWQWVLVAVLVSVVSMVCFGAVRQRTAQAAGVEIPLCQAISMSYAAGALHTTLPGGAVFSTAYAFRELRRWGASTAAATWCLAITGVLSAATLVMLGMGSIVFGGGVATSVTGLAVEISSMALLLGIIVAVTRRPLLLLPTAEQGLRLINWIRRRPPGAGRGHLATMATNLAAIRPTGAQWAEATWLSLANWLLDAACLWACCYAVGVQVSLPAVLLAYTAGMAATNLSPLPGGIGVVEGALAIGLTAAGAAAPAALAAVLVYRLISIGGVVVIGWLVLAAQRSQQHGARNPS